MKPRDFKCLFDPERNELTYGYRHGCIDGYEPIHVREVLSDDKSEYQLGHIERLRKYAAEAEVLGHKYKNQIIRTQSALKFMRDEAKNYLDNSECESGRDDCHCPRCRLEHAIAVTSGYDG